MPLLKEYFKAVITDSTNIDSNESRSCKFCAYDGRTVAQNRGIDYCYHCYFYKKNKNFKLKNEILLALKELAK